MTASGVLTSSLEVSYQPVPSILGVSPHGLFSALGIIVGILGLRRAAIGRGIDVTALERALWWGVFAGIAGARADYVISHPGQFTSILQVFAIWQGGLALFGGLIAGSAAAAFSLHRSGVDVVRTFDTAAPFLLLAIAVGRIGDLLLTDHLGTPTSGPFALGYQVPPGAQLAPGFGSAPAAPPGPGQSCQDIGQYYAGCTYHLTPAYDILGALLLIGYLIVVTRQRPPRGATFTLFVLGYSVQRLLLDFTRGVDERPLLGLTGTQLLSITLILASAAALIVISRRRRDHLEPVATVPSH